MKKRPNLLIICPDEMRGDCAGFMGNPDIQTPNMDALAARSTVFSRHMATFPKCVPARVCLMTGRYCHTDGLRSVSQHMERDRVDLLHRLRRAGYETAVFGKNHCWHPDVWESLDHRSYDAPMDGYKDFVETEPDPDGVTPLDLEDGWHYVGCNTRHMPDEGYTEQTVDFLRNSRDRDRPFFLQVNIESPHPVYGVEEPWYSMYNRDGISAWPHELPANAPLPVVKQREIRTGTEPQQEAAREVQCVYYGMISKVDSLIGRILDAVREEGLWDDTVILFWVDHGDYAGQYTLAEKWDTHFPDCLIHVPCTIRGPGLPEGAAVDSLTDHADLAPTLCELLGLEPLRGMHGQSLLPFIHDGKRKRAVFADGGHEDEMLARARDVLAYCTEPRERRPAKTQTYYQCPDTMARAKMVRTDRYKMVVRLRGGNELYDLQEDPWELNNRWGDPDLADVVPELMQMLVDWSLRTDPDEPRLEKFTV
ncbi:MAG: sulfatase-like hydrolase/transferase [Candidatus Brocadiia bacterium]